MNESKTITVVINNVEGFRKIFESKEGRGTLYGAAVSVQELYNARQQIDQTLGINPRNQKNNSLPSRAMEETLNDTPGMFVFRNRGITFLTSAVSWDNTTHELVLTMQIVGKKEDEVNGLADGGHTYSVLMRYMDQIEENERVDVDAFVRLDILTGFENSPEEVGMIVESRNTSTQVREESMLNREGYFEPIKEAIVGTNYENQIAYYENQLIDDNDPEKGYRPIKVSTLLSYLMCFDVKVFDADSHPTTAYSSKKKATDWYVARFEDDKKNNSNDLKKFLKLAKEIADFHDFVESRVPKIWNTVSGRYADQKGVKTRNNEAVLPFGNYKSSYVVPGGHVYPVISAFRSMVEEKNGEYKFKVNPQELFTKMNENKKTSILNKLVSTDDKDPQTMGKNNSLYSLCYMTVKSYYLENK